MNGNDLIARNVRRLREDLGISLAEVARRAGVAKQTLASLEAGVGNPTIETAERVAAALGVSTRALLTEMGSEVFVQHREEVAWHREGALSVRHLDHAFGSGYVVNSVLRIDANVGVSRHEAKGRGTLRHCYVLDGRLRMGPIGALTMAAAGDFLRFPADAPHAFEAVTPVAHVLVCTTSPQLSMRARENGF